MSRFPALLFLASLGLASGRGEAAPVLPYSTRTQPFAGLRGTVLGDIRTLSMAGATVALSDSLIGSADNPAGLAMTLGGGGFGVTSNRSRDSDIQLFSEPIATSSFVIGGSTYPWGFSFALTSSHEEGQHYLLPTTGELILPTIQVSEMRVSLGRVFMDNRLAAGASLTLLQGQRIIHFPADPSSLVSDTGSGVGLGAGVMYQLPRRWLLGISYQLPMTGAASSLASPGIANFFQEVKMPYRLAAGVGWIPSRIFQIGVGVYVMGATDGTALLRDETVSIGAGTTLQPRIGASYLLLEFKELSASIGGGVYHEASRIEGTGSRLHVTAGLDTHPWVFNLGWGIDVARDYRNYLLSAGVDVMKILRKLDLMPPEWRPPTAGLLPSPFHFSDEGLPRPMVKNWKERPSQDITRMGRDLPRRIGAKIDAAGNVVEDIGEGIMDGLDAVSGAILGGDDEDQKPKPKPKPKQKPKQKQKTKPKAKTAKGVKGRTGPSGAR